MKVTKHRVVTIDYTLKDSEGEVLDTSEGEEPLQYIHGTDTLVPGLERRLEGTSPGDEIAVTVEPADGYGLRDDELVVSMPRERFSEIDDLSVGMQLEARNDEGPQLITVTEIGDEAVTVDANHPLAGAVLHFDVSVREVRQATSEEIEHGHVHSGHGHHHGHDGHGHDHGSHIHDGHDDSSGDSESRPSGS